MVGVEHKCGAASDSACFTCFSIFLIRTVQYGVRSLSASA